MTELETPTHLDLLFRPGVSRLRDRDWDREIRAWRRPLGHAVLDGVLLCDPYAGADGLEPVAWPGPGAMPGAAEALSLVADCGYGGERTAALALRFGPQAAVARWERCGWLGVDVATGGFVSAGLRAQLEAVGPEGPLTEAYEADDDAGAGKVFPLHGQSAVLSSTGWGDGAYQAWWGFAGDGRPVCLALDYDVLTESIFEEARLPLPLKLGTTRPPGIPGARVKAGLFGRRRPRIDTAQLPEHDRAYTRVIDAGGAFHAPKILSRTIGSVRIDLRPYREPAALLVRWVTGTKPMDVIEDDERAAAVATTALYGQR